MSESPDDYTDRLMDKADGSEWVPCAECGEFECACYGDGGYLVTEDELRAYDARYDDPTTVYPDEETINRAATRQEKP